MKRTADTAKKTRSPRATAAADHAVKAWTDYRARLRVILADVVRERAAARAR
jgi:hypothetical protein